LQVLGQQIDVPVFVGAEGQSAVSVAKEALERAKYLMKDVLIVDTAGRTQIDESLMAELEQVAKTVNPVETFLVLDSTTGQEAVSVAEAFASKVPVTGAIFTKMDGDTRGGAVLSVRAATGIPVRFTGVGERVDALEPFFPVRVAERIIGMGDVLGIIEKAEQAFAGENVEDIEKRLGKGSFDFHDMLQTFQMMKKMGPMKNILKMLPGVGAQIPEEAFDQVNEKDTARIEAIILSMTHRERSNPDIINGSRRKRIARGSGTSVEEVNRLIKQFHESRRTMKQVAQMQRKAGKFGRFGKR
jgi:signal recognition particle subunit SRP54